MASPLRLHNVCDVPLEVKLPEAPPGGGVEHVARCLARLPVTLPCWVRPQRPEIDGAEVMLLQPMLCTATWRPWMRPRKMLGRPIKWVEWWP